MPNVDGKIDRFNRVPANDLANVQLLGEPQQIFKIGKIACSPATIKVSGMWRAADGSDIDIVFPKDERALRIAGMKFKYRRDGFDGFFHHCRIKANPRAVIFNISASLAQNLTCFRKQEIHPDLL